MQTKTVIHRSARAAALALALAGAGCELASQSAPPLTGPSELGTSLALLATPDRLIQDGLSVTTITAIARDATGRPMAGLALQWEVVASDGSFIQASARTSVTDANGGTNVQVTSPPAPSALPATPLRLTVLATPMGTNSSDNVARRVEVTMIPPMGTLPQNNLPVPAFSSLPSRAVVGTAISFDASATRDEGVACTTCTFIWSFGDGATETDNDPLTTHAYGAAGTYTVTLTVRDTRDGSASTTGTVTITIPTAPGAVITVSPSNSRPAGTVLNFDAAGSTIGTGATIVSYTWIWGDGTANTETASAQTTHAFLAPGTYVVRLIVTDNFGRTATVVATVVVL